MIKDETLNLDFPDWSDHPPPPQLASEEYVRWVETELQWLPPPTAEVAAHPAAPGPVAVVFRL